MGRDFPKSETTSSAMHFVNVYVFGQGLISLKYYPLLYALSSDRVTLLTRAMFTNLSYTIDIHG